MRQFVAPFLGTAVRGAEADVSTLQVTALART